MHIGDSPTALLDRKHMIGSGGYVGPVLAPLQAITPQITVFILLLLALIYDR